MGGVGARKKPACLRVECARGPQAPTILPLVPDNRGNGERNLCSLRSLLLNSGRSGTVELDFDKSVSDGVNIHAKRGDEADFTFLARDTASPYIDNRPLLAVGKPNCANANASMS
jgi:hypothetical protein